VGQTELNWEIESEKFLKVIEKCLKLQSKQQKAIQKPNGFTVSTALGLYWHLLLCFRISTMYMQTALKHSPHLLFRYGGYFLANAFDGISAVIAFFIISGFVIHYPNKNGIPNLTEFWIRRFLRILIPLCIILIIGSWFNHPEKTVVWSLYCELIYYGLYPFLSKIRLSWQNKFLISYAIAALFICLFAYHDIISFFKQTNINFDGGYRPGKGYVTWVIGLPCWLLGVLIAEKIDHLKHVTFRSVMIYRMLVFMVSCFCIVGEFHLHS